GVVDDVGAAIVDRERELLALCRVLERAAVDARVLDVDRGRRLSLLDARDVAGLELLDQRDLHPADEAKLVRLRQQVRTRADIVPTIYLLYSSWTLRATTCGGSPSDCKFMSTQANFFAGKSFATDSTSSENRKPMPNTMSYGPAASWRSADSRSPPSPGSMYW